MSYTVMAVQPAARAAGIPDSQIAPGLYPNELAVTLDSGQDVALYVDANPVDNNAGIVFYGSARVISANGQTQMSGAVQMVTELQHTSSQAEIAAYGASALAQCVALAMLGEPIPTVTVNSGGTSVTQPMIPWDANLLASASVRTMIAAATASVAVTTSGLLSPPSPAPAPAPAPTNS
jgi:hypothetical protein